MDVRTAEWNDIWEAWESLTEDEKALVSARIQAETLHAMKQFGAAMKATTAAIRDFTEAYHYRTTRD
jgi:hypothetical protein